MGDAEERLGLSVIRVLVALVVTCVWAGGCVVTFAAKPELVGLVTVITPVMLAVVGWLFTQEILDHRGKRERA